MAAIASFSRSITPCSAVDTGSVTVAFVRRVRAVHEIAYEQRLSELYERMRTVPGYLGVNVVHDEDLHQYTSIVRFDSLASLKTWEASGMHARWEAGIGPLVEGPADVRRAGGLEFWFRTPHHAAPLAPSRHKMALVLVVIVTVLSYILVPLIGQAMASAPRIARALAGSAIQIGLLTYVIMPRVTRLLAKWLYPRLS